jgi:hypothetical protein
MLFLKVSLLTLLSYLVLGYLAYGIVQNKFVKNQDAQNQETKSCVVGTIRVVGDLLTNFEDMVKRACSFDDMLFTAKVFLFILIENFFIFSFSSLDSSMD